MQIAYDPQNSTKLNTSDLQNFDATVLGLHSFCACNFDINAYMAKFADALQNSCKIFDLQPLKPFMLHSAGKGGVFPNTLYLSPIDGKIIRVKHYLYLLLKNDFLVYIGVTTQSDRLRYLDHRLRDYDNKVVMPIFDDKGFNYESMLLKTFYTPYNKQRC